MSAIRSVGCWAVKQIYVRALLLIFVGIPVAIGIAPLLAVAWLLGRGTMPRAVQLLLIAIAMLGAPVIALVAARVLARRADRYFAPSAEERDTSGAGSSSHSNVETHMMGDAGFDQPE